MTADSGSGLVVTDVTGSGATGRTVVLVPGAMHDARCYLTTPDGRPGWAHDLAARGFSVLIADWSPITPRAGVGAGETAAAALGTLVEELTGSAAGLGCVDVLVHSMAGPFGVRLLETHGERIGRLVLVAPGPPGNLAPAPRVLRRTDTSVTVSGVGGREITVPLTGRLAPTVEQRNRFCGGGNLFPVGALAPYLESLVPIAGEFYLERLNVDDRQLRIADPARLSGREVLVLTGTHDPVHPFEADRRVVDWLIAVGARAEHCYLGSLGIAGNAHMLMLEDNSATIAELVADWLLAP